jgi:hypothetical protein
MTDGNGLRMYFFVMGNLSGRQQGIQAGHAAIEYGINRSNDEYLDFAKNHKTFILLDGGGSLDMLARKQELIEFGIRHAVFYEPDLNNSLSAIAFIVPESIYSRDIEGLEDVYTPEVCFTRYLKGFRLASN